MHTVHRYHAHTCVHRDACLHMHVRSHAHEQPTQDTHTHTHTHTHADAGTHRTLGRPRLREPHIAPPASPNPFPVSGAARIRKAHVCVPVCRCALCASGPLGCRPRSRLFPEPGMVIPFCNPCIQEAEAGSSSIRGQLGLPSEILRQNTTKNPKSLPSLSLII
jgi:hypothetical protein